MLGYIFDGYIAPAMVPVLMSSNLLRRNNLIYTTTSFGVVLCSICSLLQFHLHRYSKSRNQLTITLAVILTFVGLFAIMGYNAIRITSQPEYMLPIDIRNVTNLSIHNPLKYHFHADLIPASIILAATQLCAIIKYDLLCQAKRKFTFGESSIIAQLTSVAFLTWAFTLYTRITSAGPYIVDLSTEILLNVGFIIFSLLFLPSYIMFRQRSTLIRYGLLGLCISASYMRAQQLISTTNSPTDPVTWLVAFVFSNENRFSLFSLWLLTLTACVCFSTSWTKLVGKTDTLMRKLFHIAVCVVFISGYDKDAAFLKFASGCILIVCLVLEIIRAWRLAPFGDHIETMCAALRGKWDNRYITVSHIYLIMGAFLPLWLLPYQQNRDKKLVFASGIIAVGVGDSAAAYIGTFFGKTRLFPSKSDKTLEGLFGNIGAMLIFKQIWIGYSTFLTEFSFIFAAFVTAVVEALISDCDNLTLPLVMNLLLEVL